MSPFLDPAALHGLNPYASSLASSAAAASSDWQNSEANKYGYPNRYGGGGMLTPPDKLNNGDQHNAHWASGTSSLTMAGSMQTPPSSPPMSIERFGPKDQRLTRDAMKKDFSVPHPVSTSMGMAGGGNAKK